ncbi:squalene/phytoene synthase family protein [Actinotalea sp. AC32]|nr:squalene/phytoene synthase family protein [Actinotalea sp. AC32]
MRSRLSLYDAVAEGAADLVVREYSTSFGLATRLLPAAQRSEIRNVYALVRLADEVVDGATDEAGGDVASARERLDALERETESAMASGYSTNVLVHAFALTARRSGITTELTRPFFASMRMDLDTSVHDEESFRRYVYGSAEVVGLMCLRVFLRAEPAARRDERYAELAPGAQALGAAFQKINFLRDLADDSDRLGRSYFVGVDPHHVTEADKAAVLDDIAADLRLARAAIDRLPPGAARAVAVACELFAELTRRLGATRAQDLMHTRVSVPTTAKVRVTARALRGRVGVR